MYYVIQRFFFILILVGFSIGLSAQVKVGVLGGVNSSKLFGDSPANSKYKTNMGVYSGIALDFYVHPSVAISLQPSYSMEGASLHYTVKGNPELVDSGKVSMNYFRLPLLAKIDFINNRFYALAGFDVGLLLNASAKMNNQDEVDINEPLTDFDCSFHSGIGYRWHINSLTLFLEGRYTIGLTNISDQLDNGSSYVPRVKNSALKVLFGIEVPLWSPQ